METEKTAQSQRVEKDARLAARAQERVLIELHAIDAAILYLTDQREKCVTASEAAEAEWAQREEAINKHEEEVIAVFQKRVNGAAPIGGQHPPAPGKDEDGVPLPDAESDEEDDADYGHYTDLELKGDTSKYPLPIISQKPEGQQAEEINKLWNFLHAIPMGSACPPVSYRQTGIANISTVEGIIGTGNMRQMYGERNITADDYVPWFVLQNAQHVLTMAHQHLTRQQEQVQEACARLKQAKLTAKAAGYKRNTPYAM
jgi:hypothetical protein